MGSISKYLGVITPIARNSPHAPDRRSSRFPHSPDVDAGGVSAGGDIAPADARGLATRADLARRWLRQGGVMTNQRL